MQITTLALLTLCALACAPSSDEYLERMEREHAGDTPLASPMASEETTAAVEAEPVSYAELDGTTVEGYLATPADRRPEAAILVIHEWWGLNDNIRSMADKLAAEGWAALAVDLYEGRSADDADGAMALATAARDDEPRVRENLRQAHVYLRQRFGEVPIGVIGWCFGGGWSLQTALMLGDGIDAAVVYYGHLTSDPDELAPLTAPLLGIFGAEDQGIPVESVTAFRDVLRDLDKEATVIVYPGAGHAFANPSGTHYVAAAAEDAWGKTLSFLHRHLDG